MIFICIRLLIIFCSCIESFIISPSPSLEGRVRMMYIYDDYFAEPLTREAGHLIC